MALLYILSSFAYNIGADYLITGVVFTRAVLLCHTRGKDMCVYVGGVGWVGRIMYVYIFKRTVKMWREAYPLMSPIEHVWHDADLSNTKH